jgi:eukaryotic-like serine/threonine-protein kinase
MCPARGAQSGLRFARRLNMALRAGVRVGPYEIVSAIGAGGMGEVYRARDTRLQRDVALKLLPAGVSSDPDRLARFEQEARAAAAINHSNILAVYDVGSYDSAPYIVSELLEGETLRERLGNGPLPARKAIECAIHVARGLAAAHERGIVHRDLKPENVFVTTDGRVKILDFGLAKLTEREPALVSASVMPTTPPKTMPGIVLGTIGYMAPEQVRGLAADARTDIFALGALLYEMLSGRRAFGGDTTIDVMTAILKEDPPDLRVADHQVPPGLQRIVDRCLEKSPAARFQTASDLAFALESLSTHSGTTPAVAIDAARPAPALWGRRAAMLWASVACVLLVATIVLAIGYVRRAPAAPAVVQFTVGEPTDARFSGGPAYAPGAAISPDGRHLVFMATRAGSSTTLLWIRSLDAPEARPLTGTDGANDPFWSPDSRSIGFFAQSKLKRVDVSGGPSQTLCDAPAGQGGTWNRDGVIVFAPDLMSALVRVSSAGGQPTAVTKLPAADKETSHRWPDFLPDGRHFLFLSQPDNVVHVGSLDSAEVTRLVNADSRALYAPGYLLFIREDTLVAQPFDAGRLQTTGEAVPVAEDIRVNPVNGRAAVAVSESGVLVYRTGPTAGNPVQLMWLDRAGKEIGKVGQPKDYRGIALSPDGQRIVLHLHEQVGGTVTGGGGLWLLDTTRGTEARFTFTGAHDEAPHWSPDGSRVVFGSGRAGDVQTLYVKPAGGASPEEVLLKTDVAKAPRSWSADGRFVVYDSAGGKTLTDIWVLPLAGDHKPIPFLTTPANEGQGELSPDGRWMVYTSNESGRSDIYVQPFPATGGKWLVSTGGGVEPHWRRDGRELYYVSPPPIKLMAVDVKTQGAMFEASAPHALFDMTGYPFGGLSPFSTTGAYAPSADGQKFLASVRPTVEVSNPLTIVLNWTAGLKK